MYIKNLNANMHFSCQIISLIKYSQGGKGEGANSTAVPNASLSVMSLALSMMSLVLTVMSLG